MPMSQLTTNMFTFFESKLLGLPFKMLTLEDSVAMFQGAIDSVKDADKNRVAHNFMFAITIMKRRFQAAQAADDGLSGSGSPGALGASTATSRGPAADGGQRPFSALPDGSDSIDGACFCWFRVLAWLCVDSPTRL